MVRYIQMVGRKFSQLKATDHAVINGVKVPPRLAIGKPKVSGTYQLKDYDSDKYYPCNFKLVNDEVEFDLIPKEWPHPRKSIRITYSQNLTWIPAFRDFYIDWIIISWQRNMIIDTNGIETVNKMYSNSFNPSSLEDDIRAMANVGYKCDSSKSGADAWTIAPIGTEGYTNVWGDPHLGGGLIIIERLKDMIVKYDDIEAFSE